MIMEQRRPFPIRKSDVEGPHYLLADTIDDEINFTDFVINIAREWKSIALVMLVGLLATLAMSHFLSRDYLVTASLRLPTESELGEVSDQSLIEIGPAGAFRRFVEYIQSPEIHMSTLEAGGFLGKLSDDGRQSSAEIFRGIDNNFSLQVIEQDHYQLGRDEKMPLRRIEVTLKTKDPETFVNYLEKLIEIAELEAISSFSSAVETLKSNKIQSIYAEIEALSKAEKLNREARIARMQEANRELIARLRLQIDLAIEQASKNRENRIIELEEAIGTAAVLNIIEPVTFDDLRPQRQSSQVTNEIGDQQKPAPLYFQGTRLLKAELDRLKARQSDKPFVSGLTELERQIAEAQNDPEIEALNSRSDDTIYIEKFDELQQSLSSLAEQPTRFENVRFAVISQSPSAPPGPVRSPLLIFVVGIVLSSLIALFFALLISALKNNLRRDTARNDFRWNDSRREDSRREDSRRKDSRRKDSRREDSRREDSRRQMSAAVE